MREHDLQPRRRRRYVATTDGDHDLPLFPNLAKEIVPEGPDQLWVADITYVAIPAGFARSEDVRLTLAALQSAIEKRRPPPGCIHHTDRNPPNTRPGATERSWRSMA